jgi:hypothetical protein
MSAIIPWYQQAHTPRACGCTLGRDGRCCMDRDFDYSRHAVGRYAFPDVETTYRAFVLKPRVRVKAGRQVVA